MTAHPPPALRSVPQSCRMRPRPSDGPAVAPIRGTGLLAAMPSWRRYQLASVSIGAQVVHATGAPGAQVVPCGWRATACLESMHSVRPSASASSSIDTSVPSGVVAAQAARQRIAQQADGPTVACVCLEAALLRRFLPSPPPRPAAVTQGDRRWPLPPTMPPHQHHGHASAWPDCAPTPSSPQERRGACVVADHRRRAASGVEPTRSSC